MIELTDWLRAELVRRADAEAPEECCGLISEGSKGVCLWDAENAAADPSSSFIVGAASQLAILRQIDERAEKIAGVFHSHATDPIPSEADLAFAAAWPGLIWVIVARSEPPTFWSGVLA